MRHQYKKIDLSDSSLRPFDQSNFFNLPEFIFHQGFEFFHLFESIDQQQNTCIRAVFVTIGNQWVSLPKAPFGGIYIHGDIETVHLEDFISFIKLKAKFFQVQKIILKQPSSVYCPQISIIHEQPGLQTQFSDSNQHIDIPSFDIRQNFHKMQRRRVSKCLDANFSFINEKHHSAYEIHAFISKCRQEKGIKINIDLKHFIESLKAFPLSYDLFTIRHAGKIIAATVIVKINKSVVYNYLPASSMTYAKYSPMVFLIAKLVEFYHFKQYQVLDLGVSSIEGIEQKSLKEFKQRLGAMETKKYTYSINI